MREHRRATDILLEMGPPLFGLRDTVPMYRSIGGCSWGSSRLAVGLHHRWDDVSVEIETQNRGPEPHADEDGRALSIWTMLHVAQGRWRPEEYPLRFEIERRQVVLPVDGAPVSFTFFGHELDWAGYGLVGERLVRVDTRRCDAAKLELVEVDPLAQYVDPSA